MKTSRTSRIFNHKKFWHFAKQILIYIHSNLVFVYRISLRQYLPSIGYRTENGVRVEKKYMLDNVIIPKYKNKEGGIISSHQNLTQSGDNIVIVGGGNGITAVRAAKIIGEKGKVTIYEGGREAVDKINNVIEMNRVGDRCEVHYAIVGKERNVYGGESTNADIIQPDGIPDCDVLELDCEGSEIDILTELSIQPRLVIAELHPWNFQEEPDALLKILAERGYKIQHRFGHDGTALSEKEFETLLSNSNVHGEEYIESGACWPVVIAAVRHDS